MLGYLIVFVVGVLIGWHFLPQPSWVNSLLDWIVKKVVGTPTVTPPPSA